MRSRRSDVEIDSSTLEAVSAVDRGAPFGIAALKSALGHDGATTPLEEAEHALHELLPAMDAVRRASDELETMVADDLWPLPTYQEMLFIL